MSNQFWRARLYSFLVNLCNPGVGGSKPCPKTRIPRENYIAWSIWTVWTGLCLYTRRMRTKSVRFAITQIPPLPAWWQIPCHSTSAGWKDKQGQIEMVWKFPATPVLVSEDALQLAHCVFFCAQLRIWCLRWTSPAEFQTMVCLVNCFQLVCGCTLQVRQTHP